MDKPRKRRILVADDDKHCAALLKDFLQDAGYEVALVCDGEMLYRVAPELLPDLIITDLDMPGLSGGAVQSLLRVSPKTKRIPILFITGQPEDRQAHLVEFRPENKIFQKPLDLKALALAIADEFAAG